MPRAKKYIIACEVFRKEIEYLIEKNTHEYETFFLAQSFHENPQALKEKLQETIDFIEDKFSAESIIVFYGFCGRAMHKVQTKKARLIVPKVHDCIPLLLGTGAENSARPSTFSQSYWLSAGWVNYSINFYIEEREKRYNSYVELYGEDSANYLMEVEDSWKAHYKAVTLIKWEELYSEELTQKALLIAKDMNLPYKEVVGSASYVTELLQGGQNTENFFHIPPDFTLDINSEGHLCLVCTK